MIGRFASKIEMVTESGCWIWMAGLFTNGYGKFWINGKTQKAHRVSYEQYIGNKIPDGLLVCHVCDVRSCVNPHHLFLGTNKDNLQDMVKKGRSHKNRGEDHGISKLRETDIVEIRKSTLTQRVLAEKYDISQAQISNVKTLKHWKHVTIASIE